MVVGTKKKKGKKLDYNLILKRPKNEAKKKMYLTPPKKMGKKMRHRKKCPFSLNGKKKKGSRPFFFNFFFVPIFLIGLV